LIEALAPLASLPWRLTIAGDRTRDPATSAQLDADIARQGLCRPRRCVGCGGRRSSRCFVRRRRYVRAGVALRRFTALAYAEAMARGLPIVGTTAGAIPDTVPPNAGNLGGAE
jgi:glycosyltransferase involved in cell wall biosynthesis